MKTFTWGWGAGELWFHIPLQHNKASAACPVQHYSTVIGCIMCMCSLLPLPCPAVPLPGWCRRAEFPGLLYLRLRLLDCVARAMGALSGKR